MSTSLAIYKLIDQERGRQARLQAQGKFRFTIADTRLAHSQRLGILLEEVGEVAARMNELGPCIGSPYDAELILELVQVAACAVGWLEAMGLPRYD